MTEPTTEAGPWTVESDGDDRHVLSAPGDNGTVVLYGDRKYADMLVSAALVPPGPVGAPSPERGAVTVRCSAIWNGCRCGRKPHRDDRHVWMNALDDGAAVDPAEYPEARATQPLTLERLTEVLADALTKDWPGDTRYGAAPAIAAVVMERLSRP